MGVIDYLLLAVIFGLVFISMRHMHQNKSGCRGCQNCQYRKECVKRRGNIRI